MKKRICILTKSSKHGGYCVAGIDIDTKQWIRLISSEDPSCDQIKKDEMVICNQEINCLDIIEFDFLKNVPTNCQTENWLVNKNIKPKYCGKISLEKFNSWATMDNNSLFIMNSSNSLCKDEIEHLKRSLFIFKVQNLKIDTAVIDYFGEAKPKNKCSFSYNNHIYSNMSLTDPEYRDPKQNGLIIDNALIVASLPCLPYQDGLYYKFVAKIFPIEEKNNLQNNSIKIHRAGFFYNVYGNDALLLNKIFHYQLYGKNMDRAGFAVKQKSLVLNKLDELCINYQVYEYEEQPVIKKTFTNNNYQTIDRSTYTPINKKAQYEYYDISRSEILLKLASGINPFTGEVSDFIDEKTKIALHDIAKIISKKENEEKGFRVKIN